MSNRFTFFINLEGSNLNCHLLYSAWVLPGQPVRRGTARAGEPPARRCLARWWAVPTAMLTARASGSEGAASGFVSVDQLTPDHPVAGIPEKKMYAAA